MQKKKSLKKAQKGEKKTAEGMVSQTLTKHLLEQYNSNKH